MSDRQEQQIHGSAISLGGRGCLIVGEPGSGKSALAIGMLTLGADLIADDQVRLTRTGSTVMLSAPDDLPALIEGRGVGLLRVELGAPAPLALIVDLDHTPDQRLPRARQRDLLGLSHRVSFARGVHNLPAILRLALLGGLVDPENADLT
ncbi:MAG: serine kinase [Pseudomonadota bacterium]